MASLTAPRQMVLITSRAIISLFGREETKDNIHATSWHTPSSLDPKTYTIAMRKNTLTYELINKSKAFVVNFIPFTLEKEALFCEKHSGLHIDKFARTGLTKEDSAAVDCPRIREALGYVECEVINEIDVGDHVLFIGKVVHMHLDKPGKRLLARDKDKFTTTLD